MHRTAPWPRAGTPSSTIPVAVAVETRVAMEARRPSAPPMPSVAQRSRSRPSPRVAAHRCAAAGQPTRLTDGRARSNAVHGAPPLVPPTGVKTSRLVAVTDGVAWAQ
eukprot:TRINITY_DN2564_c0_g1_i2.p2 TRINITY_DN2564_c0_g1~~TRINITY_DN2564_c0_g1_i2.p2  ORF type:complete len:107 (+),score=4.29 TRINITY_DN2564_c0_g1_i2:269-589(+)